MFKILKNNCAGLDVHKTWVYACIGITENGMTSYHEARFSTFKSDLERLVGWLQEYHCADVCMESAGKYWIPVYDALELYDIHCTVAHPKYTKPIKGNKTDRKDAKWICDLYMCGMIKPSFIPPEDIRNLRSLTRYRAKCINMKSSEKNRVLNCLTISGLKLDEVFSDVFGKSGMALITEMMNHPGESFDVTPFVNPRCKAPIAQIQDAVDGVISGPTHLQLQEHLQHIKEIDSHIEHLDASILTIGNYHSQELDLIRTVPGFDSKDSMSPYILLAEIGGDMSVFPTAKHLVSYVGCCPRNDSSNGKIKCNRMSHAGTYLKPLLVTICNSLVNSDKHPEIQAKYRRVKAHRGHKKAIFAVCNMLLTAIWNVLSKKEAYSAAGYLTVSITPSATVKNTVISRSTAEDLLRKMGFIITDDEDKKPEQENSASPTVA